MILGLSHVALSTDDIERSAARLSQLGYTLRFDEPFLENHAAKAGMLDHYHPRHHIRSLEAPGGMAIELLNHGPMSTRQAAGLIPVFRSAAPLDGWQARAADDLPMAPDAWPLLERALDARLLVFEDPELRLTLLWYRSDEAPGLFACAVPTADISGMEDILKAMRFRADPRTGLWSLLTPIPALQARLIPVPFRAHENWQARAPLDATGCPCMALMARGTDQTQLPDALRGTAETFTLTINEKPSRITLLRPDQGPVIELVDQQI